MINEIEKKILIKILFGNGHLEVLFPPEQSKYRLHLTLYNSHPATNHGHDEHEDHEGHEGQDDHDD